MLVVRGGVRMGVRIDSGASWAAPSGAQGEMLRVADGEWWWGECGVDETRVQRADFGVGGGSGDAWGVERVDEGRAVAGLGEGLFGARGGDELGVRDEDGVIGE